MTLLQVLEVLTLSSAKGVKLFADRKAIDDCLIFKGRGSDLAKLTIYHNEKVFQIITLDFEGYVDIILD